MHYILLLIFSTGWSLGAISAEVIGVAAAQLIKTPALAMPAAKAVGKGQVSSVETSAGQAVEEARSLEPDSDSPFAQVDQVTSALVAAISRHKDGYPANEQIFFAAITAILTPHVDFSYMAKNVMGPYRKKASMLQRSAFAEAFQLGLTETYGRGLMSFNNEKIVVVNRKLLHEKQRKVVVKQQIYGADQVYPLAYTMKRKKIGAWMITNVVINGINLGKVLRNQFVQAAKKNAGDLDVVIADWSSESS